MKTLIDKLMISNWVKMTSEEHFELQNLGFKTCFSFSCVTNSLDVLVTIAEFPDEGKR